MRFSDGIDATERRSPPSQRATLHAGVLGHEARHGERHGVRGQSSGDAATHVGGTLMFGKELESTVQEGRVNSILGKGCKCKGTIDVEGTLRIDSEFEGVVNCPDTLVVGKTGIVKADINVKN